MNKTKLVIAVVGVMKQKYKSKKMKPLEIIPGHDIIFEIDSNSFCSKMMIITAINWPNLCEQLEMNAFVDLFLIDHKFSLLLAITTPPSCESRHGIDPVWFSLPQKFN
jgi:hypothetical protein